MRDKFKTKLSQNVYAVVLAGGKGVRLRPISTEARPKAFLPISEKDETMFRKTLNRLSGIVPSDNIIVVSGKTHARLIKLDFPGIKRANLLLEPCSRNTAPAIAYAALNVIKRAPDAIMIVLPADHYITDESRYVKSLRVAVKFLQNNPKEDSLIVMGIRPTFPATIYGYIKLRRLTGAGRYKDVIRADRFVEKPDIRKAKKFIKSRAYLWNSGIFIFRAGSLIKEMGKFSPEILNSLRSINSDNLPAVYEKLPNISIDYAVMEKASNIYCVPSAYGWRDLGSFEKLGEAIELSLKKVKDKKRLSRLASYRILKKIRQMQEESAV